MKLNPFKRDPDPFAASRYDGMFKGVRVRSRKRPFILRHRWAWISFLVLALGAGVAGFAVYQYFSLQADVQEPVAPVEEAAEGKPFNVLLVGSDSREGLSEEQQQDLGADDVAADGTEITGERADTLILAHIDPEEDRVTMVQFPRDLYVPVATGGQAKINSALEIGKAALVTTVEDLTGLQINRYAQVNIAGFKEVVDALGGVKICITEPVPFDDATGIEITQEEIDESPLIPFDGERALRFVRSRNFPNGDFARIQNQQRFLSAALNKVTSLGTIFNPARIGKLMAAARDNVRVDDNTDLTELRGTLERFRDFDPDNYEAYTAPNLGITNNEAGSVVVPDLETLEVMFEAIKANKSPAEADNAPDIDPSTVTVRFYNGTFEEGVAGAAQEKLREAIQLQGKTVETLEPTNADSVDYKKSVVRYNPEGEDMKTKLELLRAAIPDIEFKKGGTLGTEDFSIIIGKSGFKAEKVVQITPLELSPPGQVPADCR